MIYIKRLPSFRPKKKLWGGGAGGGRVRGWRGADWRGWVGWKHRDDVKMLKRPIEKWLSMSKRCDFRAEKWKEKAEDHDLEEEEEKEDDDERRWRGAEQGGGEVTRTPDHQCPYSSTPHSQKKSWSSSKYEHVYKKMAVDWFDWVSIYSHLSLIDIVKRYGWKPEWRSRPRGPYCLWAWLWLSIVQW